MNSQSPVPGIRPSESAGAAESVPNSDRVGMATADVRDSISRLRRLLRETDPRLAADFGSAALPIFGALDLVDDLVDRGEG